MEVYVVTYWKEGMEPVVTIFSNNEAASLCYGYFKGQGYECALDKAPVYGNFSYEKG